MWATKEEYFSNKKLNESAIDIIIIYIIDPQPINDESKWNEMGMIGKKSE